MEGKEQQYIQRLHGETVCKSDDLIHSIENAEQKYWNNTVQKINFKLTTYIEAAFDK